jgi:NTE family protein
MKPLRFFLVFFVIVNFSFYTDNSLLGQKVAVVLSGGAAKGGAHIGVLKALEEHQIPIDFIVGTSIGAVIGGMYASGFSPDEIEKIVASEEFQRWAAGAIDDKYNFYCRREDPNASWIETSFDFRRKLTTILPTHLVKSFEIDLQIMRIFSTANAVSGENFDSLMIPFRCLVSDIDSSQQKIIANGDLSKAIRGSMSIPIFFNPVEIDKKLVFDGGIYNNFPCDIARREFNPDVIIGSRVAQRYQNPDKDDIVSQLLTMLMERQSDTLSYPNSVMIVPDIPSINLLDFSRTIELADSGYHSTLRKIAEIRKLVFDSTSPETMTKRRFSFNSAKPVLQFDSIHITGLNNVQSAYVVKLLKHEKKTITFEELCRGYFRFLDEGFVKLIYPSTRFNPRTGNFDLYLDVTPANKFSAQFGGNFSLANTSEAFLEFQYKYLWTKALRFYANGYFGRVYSSAKVNGRVDFNSKTPWFAELSYTYNQFNYFRNTTFFFDDKNPGYVIDRENFGKLTLGFPMTMTGKLTLGMNYAFTNNRYYQNNQFSRNDTADQTSFDFFSPVLTFDLNSLNRKQYPNAGVRLLLKLAYISGSETMFPGSTAINKKIISDEHQWAKFQLIYDNYFESFGPVKLGFYGECVVSNQPLFSNYLSSLIYAPAFQPIPEAQTYFLPSFRANNYAAAGVKLVLRITKKVDYRIEGYLFQPYQEIIQNPVDFSAYYGKKFADRSYMASTALIYHSPLGPVGITLNYYDKMPERFTLNFSIGYIIFNEQAMP